MAITKTMPTNTQTAAAIYAREIMSRLRVLWRLRMLLDGTNSLPLRVELFGREHKWP